MNIANSGEFDLVLHCFLILQRFCSSNFSLEEERKSVQSLENLTLIFILLKTKLISAKFFIINSECFVKILLLFNLCPTASGFILC